ncbi:hypothetical protein [Streptomyces sp. NRRL F-4489]|uniref:hypothetical protein n=1 Tax=Streptomyces sp. NRRL F-4489 TaxID=1609095 RepID=UPI000A7A5650|nr:hypothetical protein [Streptomyces sp. NRRL F-4489]
MTTATDHRPGGLGHLPARPAAFWDPRTPVHFDAALTTWHVFSRADVLRVLDEKETFSAGYGLTDEQRRHAHPSLAGMRAAEGARHDDLRAAVADPFRRTVLDRLTGEVRALVTALLDDVLAAGTGRLDAVRAFAGELPSRVICRLLGLDLSYAARPLRHPAPPQPAPEPGPRPAPLPGRAAGPAGVDDPGRGGRRPAAGAAPGPGAPARTAGVDRGSAGESADGPRGEARRGEGRGAGGRCGPYRPCRGPALTQADRPGRPGRGARRSGILGA